jgi:hypothetical protein
LRCSLPPQQSKSGALYIKYSLKTQEKNLDKSKRISKQLEVYMKTLSTIVERVIEVGGSVGAEDDAFDSDKPELKKAVDGIQQLKQQCDLILQQSGQNAKGPATPVAPPSTSGSAAVSAVATRGIISNSRSANCSREFQVPGRNSSLERAQI